MLSVSPLFSPGSGRVNLVPLAPAASSPRDMALAAVICSALATVLLALLVLGVIYCKRQLLEKKPSGEWLRRGSRTPPEVLRLLTSASHLSSCALAQPGAFRLLRPILLCSAPCVRALAKPRPPRLRQARISRSSRAMKAGPLRPSAMSLRQSRWCIFVAAATFLRAFSACEMSRDGDSMTSASQHAALA